MSYRIERDMREYLPCLTEEDQRIIDQLPSAFVLPNVPYVVQEQQHFSASAVVQMLGLIYNLTVGTQTAIASAGGWSNWSTYTHSTYKEMFSRYMVDLGLWTAQYYPMSFVATKMGSGLEATKFIRANAEYFSTFDFNIFKAMLLKRRAPVKLRVHFSTNEYPMSSAMAEKIDMAGHCVLLVGWNDLGFVVHDPWNRSTWGGTRGGAYITIPYAELKYSLSFVNYSLEEADPIEPGDNIKAIVYKTPDVVTYGSTITVEAEWNWPGIKNYSLKGIRVRDISATLTVGGGATIVGSPTIVLPASNVLVPGGYVRAKWSVIVPSTTGSYHSDVTFEGTFVYPAIPWESLPEKTAAVSRVAMNRFCVFDPAYLATAGVMP